MKCKQMKCKLCGGESFKLGQLGTLIWYRCRSCGIEFYRKARKVKKGAG